MAASGVQLEVDVSHLELLAQPSGDRCGLDSASIGVEEALPPFQDRRGARHPACRQIRRHHPRHGRVASVEVLAGGSVAEELEEARTRRPGDAQGPGETLGVQTTQISDGRRGAESSYGAGSVESHLPVDGAHGCADPPCYLVAQDDGGEQALKVGVLLFRNGKSGWNSGATVVQAHTVAVPVVQFQGVASHAVDQRREECVGPLLPPDQLGRLTTTVSSCQSGSQRRCWSVGAC